MNKQPVSGIVSFKEQNGLTWMQVAALFGVTVSACHHWRSGFRSMPGSVVRLLAVYRIEPKLIKTVLMDLQ